MGFRMSTDPLSAAAAHVAGEARRLRPWVYGLFVLAVVLVVSEIATDGIASTAQLKAQHDTGDRVTLVQMLGAFLRQVLHAAPAIALTSALWSAQNYLGRLEKGDLWATSTAALVDEVGRAMASASVLMVAIVPTVGGWLNGHVAVRFDLETLPVVLGGLGLALIVVSRGLRSALDAAMALKSEHDQIV